MLWRAVKAYMAHDDPQARAANLTAIMVAANQPFYPLYVYLAVSHVVWPTFLTFLSTPFFCAVPAVTRRSATSGKALLPTAGLFNAALCVKAFGSDSGVLLFLGPCIMLAGMLFRREERFATYGVLALAGLVFVAPTAWYGAPLHAYSMAENDRFFTLNAASVITLLAFLALLLSNLLGEIRPGHA